MELPRSFDGESCLPGEVVPAAVRAAILASRGSGEPVAGYLYDLGAAEARAAALIAALPPAGRVCYALKANSFPLLASALAEVVHGFEVASATEARLAVLAAAKAGVPPRLVASGPAKNPSLLAALVGSDIPMGALTVNVESILELHRLSRAAVAAGRRAPGQEVAVALRVNPERTPISASASIDLQMGGVASPFGLPEADVPEAIAALNSLPGVRFNGFHLHAVTGNMDAGLHAEYVRWALDWSVRTAAEYGLELKTVDVGGGLGIPFEPGPEFDLEEFGAALSRLEIPPGVELIFEPGRWLVGPIGWYATEVVDVKHSYGETFVVVRGGINHFQLPTSWEIRHNFAVLPIDEWPYGLPRPSAENVRVTIAGELCTPEDVLARDVTVGCVRAGDVVVFPNAGSYGFEFAMSAFLSHPAAWRTALTRPDGHPPRPRPASRVDDLSNMG